MWLYLPESILPPSIMPTSAPEDLDLVSLCALPWAKDCVLWCSSSGKPMPYPISWPGWRKRPWIKRQSGIALNPLTATLGVAQWTSSLRGFRASHSVSPASVRAPKTSAGSGEISSASFARLEIQSETSTFSWRMSQGSLLAMMSTASQDGAYPLDSGMFLETWPRWGSMRNGVVYERKKLVLRMSAPASSSWATPVASRAFRDLTKLEAKAHTEDLASQATHWSSPKAMAGGPNSNRAARQLNGHDVGGPDLQEQAQKWQTPVTDSFRSRSGDRKDEQDLDQQARKWPSPRAEDSQSRGNHPDKTDSLTGATANWQTPRARESGQYQIGKDGEEQTTLAGQVSNWSTPTVNDVAATGALRPSRELTGRTTDYLSRQAIGWPSPQARDAKNADASTATLEKNSRLLNEMACQFSRPVPVWVDMALSMTFASFDDQTLTQLGDAIRPNSPTQLPGATSSKSTRRLNPLFGELLMGLPLNWTRVNRTIASTDYASWEVESYRLLRRLLFAYSLSD